MKNISGTIEQVYNITDSLLRDCYYIANQARPGEAENIWYSLKDDVEKRGHVMFVCKDANFIYGFIKGSIAQNNSKIEWLFVDSKYRRQGIGQQLLAVYTAFCKKNNVAELSLYSAPTPQARAFYQHNGFEMVGANYRMQKYLTRG